MSGPIDSHCEAFFNRLHEPWRTISRDMSDTILPDSMTDSSTLLGLRTCFAANYDVSEHYILTIGEINRIIATIDKQSRPICCIKRIQRRPAPSQGA